MELRQVAVRAARPEDAPAAGPLLYVCGPAPSEAMWGSPPENAIRVWRELFSIPRHICSYSHALVAGRDSQVAGLLLGLDAPSFGEAQRAMGREIRFRWFRIMRLRHLPGLLCAIADMARTFEPLSDEDYCIQALAVLPEERRQGIATQLMKRAADVARSKGMERLVLDVVVDNSGARRLYEHVGFREVKRTADPRFCRRFGVSGSIRMAKQLTARP
jgi:GNAT superfamily N-acetyltransferase